MGVPFKKIPRKDPRKTDAAVKYYPQLVTLGANASLEDMAYVMKEKSSLTLGDIKSVITNFVEALIDKLYSGQSVNIKDFGVFSLSARTVGAETVEECTAKNGQKIDFYDLEALLKKNGSASESGPADGTGDTGNDGGGGNVDENPFG